MYGDIINKEIKKIDVLPKDTIEKCHNFVLETMKTYKGEYDKRNQINIDKIEQDFLIGQIGVAHVDNYYTKLGYEVLNIKGEKGVNYEIGAYWGKNELIIDSIVYRIKTQSISMSQIYGTSWTFNLDPRDPILDNPEGNMIFVLVDDVYKKFSANIYPPYKIKELKFTDPKRKELLGKKKIVLEENLSCYKGIRTVQKTIEDLI